MKRRLVEDDVDLEKTKYARIEEKALGFLDLYEDIKVYNIFPETDAGSLLALGMTCAAFQSMIPKCFAQKYSQDLVPLVEDIKTCPRDSPFYKMLRKALVSVWPESPNCVRNSKLRGNLTALEAHLDKAAKPAYRGFYSRINLWGSKSILSHVKGFQQVTEVLLKEKCYARYNVDAAFVEEIDLSLLKDVVNDLLFTESDLIDVGRVDAVDYLVNTLGPGYNHSEQFSQMLKYRSLDEPMDGDFESDQAKLSLVCHLMNEDNTGVAVELLKRITWQSMVNLMPVVYSRLPFEPVLDICHGILLAETIEWLLYFLNSGRSIHLDWLNDPRLFNQDDVNEEAELFAEMEDNNGIEVDSRENIGSLFMIALMRQRPASFLTRLVQSRNFELDTRYFYLVDMLKRSTDLLDALVQKLPKEKQAAPGASLLKGCQLRNASLSMSVVVKLAEHGYYTFEANKQSSEFLIESMEYLLIHNLVPEKAYYDLLESLMSHGHRPSVVDRLMSYKGGRLLMNAAIFREGQESSNVAEAFISSKSLEELLTHAKELDYLPDTGDLMTVDKMRTLRPFLLKAILMKKGGALALHRLGLSRFFIHIVKGHGIYEVPGRQVIKTDLSVDFFGALWESVKLYDQDNWLRYRAETMLCHYYANYMQLRFVECQLNGLSDRQAMKLMDLVKEFAASLNPEEHAEIQSKRLNSTKCLFSLM